MNLYEVAHKPRYGESKVLAIIASTSLAATKEATAWLNKNYCRNNEIISVVKIRTIDRVQK